MEVKGRLIKILPAQTGHGRNGEWKKQGFVIETEGSYPKKVHFQVWNDKVSVDSLAMGAMMTVFFDPESREFQEKWYTDLTAFKVEAMADSIQNAPPMPPIEAYQYDMDLPPVKDDLPF